MTSIRKLDDSSSREKPGVRVRSASTGRDKRSEFQARYWAFLFGNLQRAVDEIYKTVEYYENLASCKEAILVLENYVREFRALAEFFKLSWDYEKTPLPQRPQSLAWEVRKTNTAPRVRNKNMTSPSMSGKSSPNYSGTNSPCPTIEENKLAPSPNKLKSVDNRAKDAKQETPSIEVTNVIDPLAERERKFEQLLKDANQSEQETLQKPKSISLENLNQLESSEQFQYQTPKSDGSTQTEGIEDDNLTLLEYLTKYCTPNVELKIVETPTLLPMELKHEIKTNEEKVEVTEAIKEVPIAPPAKPQEAPKHPLLVTQHSTEKPIPKFTPRVPNYSLRNQTISSKNPRAPAENIIRKSTAAPHIVNRVSRPPPRTSANANIPRPTTVLNRDNTNVILRNQINLSIRSKTMIEIPKNRPIFRTSELLKRNSREDNTDSSTSTLKASTEHLGSRGYLASGDGKKVAAVKNQKSAAENQASGDGWFTVKTKRRSSWASARFDQPSASASLPTLTLLNENSDDSDKELTKDAPGASKSAISMRKVASKVNAKPIEQKKDPPKSKQVKETPKSVQKSKPLVSSLASTRKISSAAKAKVNSNAPTKRVTVNEKCKSPPLKQNQTNQNTIKRQKSDITGLKIKSLHKEFLRSGKAPHKRHEEDTESKVDMNVQTSNLLISSTIDNLYTELGGKEGKFTNGSLSSCDELEERDDLESDDDQKKLLEEQLSLERQIRELENSEIDVDTETDETDCEAILCDLEDIESSENNDPDTGKIQSPFLDDDMTLEMRYAPMLADLTMMERAETLATLQELVARDPGRAQKLHQKLSSPSRRRSFHETLKKYQAKQSRAQEKRHALHQKKAYKIQQLIQRVEQVKAAKQQLIETRRLRMEERLQRATENRENFLKNKIKKAHDEEEKLKEIAFIKSLEAQNKRLDFIESLNQQENRLQDLEQERQKKTEEKAAKEAAVERRRLELEMERIKKLEKMDETR